MIRMLLLASFGAVIVATSMANHIQNYPRGLKSLFGNKREVVTEKEKERVVCQSEECKTIAQVMKDSMNESIDPCDDFYEYACGQWTIKNPTPENTTSWSLWDMVQKKIDKQVEAIVKDEPEPDDFFAVKLSKMWYKSCMDTEAQKNRGVEPLLSTLWRHGGWPLIMQDGEWDSTIYNWQIVDDLFARLLGFNAFHDIDYDRISYDGNATLLIEYPHLPTRIHRLLNEPVPPLTDSSDENNESGEGSQEQGSKEKGNNKDTEDENEENNEDEEENTKESEDKDEGELRRKKLVGRKGNKRVGKGARKHAKNKITNKGISERKLRKRTKRDIVKAKVLHSALRRKLDKSKQHHNAKTKHEHLSRKSNHDTNRKNHNIAHSKKIGHETNEENSHKSKAQRNNKLSKRKGNKRLGRSRRKNNKKKAKKVHVHERNSKIYNKKHDTNKISNHRAHHAANKINASRRRHVQISDAENTKSDTEDKNESEEEDNNVDKTDGSNGEEENDDSNNSVENNEDNISTDNDESEEDNNNDEQSDDEEDDDADDYEEDDDEDNDEESDEENDDEDDDEESDEEDDDERNIEELKETYRQYIYNISSLLAKARGIAVPKEKLEKDIADLVEFSIKVAQLTVDTDVELVSMQLDVFQEEFDNLDSDVNTSPNSKVNWKRKIQKLFEEAGVELEDDVEVMMICQAYLNELKKVLDETPSETIVNYVHWVFVDKMAQLSTPELEGLAENWSTRHFDSREEQCVQQVEMFEIVGYEYVKKHFSEEIERTARDMIDDIQKEVELQIEESTWMDDDTKHFVLDKLVAMENVVGHSGWYFNSTAVKKYFQGLTIGPSYYENILNYLRHRRWKKFRKILEPELDDEEIVDPLMVNAFFIPTKNSITITAADFQNPMFALNRPWNINYGIIGVIMGHEVNHGFDDAGRLYDRKGIPLEWLTAMADAYNERAECFIDQFNKYSLFKHENYTVENYGNKTIGENIADTMGLQAVYRAYQRRQRVCKKPDPALPGFEEYSNDQIFFLSFANLWCDNEDRDSVIESAKYDVHSTGRLRVIGSVSNSEDFAKAFKCPVGSPMNPEKKCNIWI